MKIGFYGGKFLPLHMGHISCIIQSSNMCDKLYVGISYSNIRDAELFNGRLKYIPLQKRIEWLKQVAIPLKNVEVFSFEDGDGIDYISWEDGAKQIMNHIGENVDCVFGSEPSYREVFKKYYPHAKYIMLDHNRKEYPISATEIRLEGVFKHWEYIPNICKPYYNKKIVVVGTESCGKSMLVEKLAMSYNTTYVGEYGRTMCDELNTGQPPIEYYPYIAYGHKMNEYEQNKTANKVLIIDTEAITTQFYSELYEGKSYKLFNEITSINDYDLWLYLEPDIKWVDDGMRIHGDDIARHNNDEKLKAMLARAGIKFEIIKGNYQERFRQAREHIDWLIK